MQNNDSSSQKDPIIAKYGSYARFYSQVAKDTGTHPQQVLEVASNMSAPQAPQNEIQNANTQTPVSQVTRGPIPMSSNKVGAQMQNLQSQGMGQAQAVNAAATNPQNRQPMAKGKLPNPPTPQQIQQDFINNPPSAADTARVEQALGKTGASKQPPQAAPKQQGAPISKADQQNLANFDNSMGTLAQRQALTQNKAKGGPVDNKVGNLNLHQILQLLATHPGLSGQGGGSMNTPMKSTDMKFGGGIKSSSDPAANPHPGKQGRSPGLAILNNNADVQSYASGGPVEDSGVQNNDAGASGGLLSMAEGGPVEMAGGGSLEEDQITGYGPDGTPIIQNPDGSVSYGDINQLLDRPENASTIGTGQTPGSQSSKAANAPVVGNAMAKGGEETGPPPGSLSKEVADDIPAQLSEGEFVFSADAVRFFGLEKLNAMMDFARQELDKMNNEGSIRSPGDGKNPDQQGLLGQFNQDQQPDTSAYTPDEKGEDEAPQSIQAKMGGGPVHMANGGPVSQLDREMQARQPTKMAMGGGVSEESQYKKGGKVQPPSFGRDNMTSSQPQGGAVPQDYDRGGIVSSTSVNLSPKKGTVDIPTHSLKTGSANFALKGVTIPHIKAKTGGLLRSINDTQSHIGS